jgi:L-fuculose-phosphate aldolase
MGLDEARASVVRHAQRMESDGLTVATSGNLSVRCGDMIAITPSGVDYGSLDVESVPVCALDGTVVEGGLAPSSELPMHLAVYESTGCGAVVHPHSLYATVLSTLVEELPPIHYLLALFGGRVRVARYETYGTRALASSVRAALEGRSGALLASHGSITVGGTLDEAYTKARYLEWLCQVYYLANQAGSPAILPDEEIQRVMTKIAHYGQPGAGPSGAP